MSWNLFSFKRDSDAHRHHSPPPSLLKEVVAITINKDKKLRNRIMTTLEASNESFYIGERSSQDFLDDDDTSTTSSPLSSSPSSLCSPMQQQQTSPLKVENEENGVISLPSPPHTSIKTTPPPPDPNIEDEEEVNCFTRFLPTWQSVRNLISGCCLVTFAAVTVDVMIACLSWMFRRNYDYSTDPTEPPEFLPEYYQFRPYYNGN